MIKDKLHNSLTDIIIRLDKANGWDLPSRGLCELATRVMPHVLASDVERKDVSIDEALASKVIINYYKDGPTVELWRQPFDNSQKSQAIEEYIIYMKKIVRRNFPGFLDTDIEDLVQESWIRIDGAIDSFHFRSKLSTWVNTIVANCCKQKLRRDGTGGRGIEKDALSIDELNFREEKISRIHHPNTSLISNDQYMDPQKAANLDTLSFVKDEIDCICAQMREVRNTAKGRQGVSIEIKKRIAYRRFLLDSTNSEIAEEMGLNVNTVNTVIYRIQNCLRGSTVLKEWFGMNTSVSEGGKGDEVF